jgi:hypothetical protein
MGILAHNETKGNPMRFYTDPSRADTYTHPYSLPDAEVFYVSEDEIISDFEDEYLSAGYYWQSCFPGCLPDGSPNGPFDTEAQAIADAREGM